MAKVGADNPKDAQREKELGRGDLRFCYFHGAFWDVFGEAGMPLRTTVSEMGPLLLSRLLGLFDTQSGLLSLTFKVADDQGLLLLDLKDLRAMLSYVGDNAKTLTKEYGNVSTTSLSAK